MWPLDILLDITGLNTPNKGGDSQTWRKKKKKSKIHFKYGDRNKLKAKDLSKILPCKY